MVNLVVRMTLPLSKNKLIVKDISEKSFVYSNDFPYLKGFQEVGLIFGLGAKHLKIVGTRR